MFLQFVSNNMFLWKAVSSWCGCGGQMATKYNFPHTSSNRALAHTGWKKRVCFIVRGFIFTVPSFWPNHPLFVNIASPKLAAGPGLLMPPFWFQWYIGSGWFFSMIQWLSFFAFPSLKISGGKCIFLFGCYLAPSGSTRLSGLFVAPPPAAYLGFTAAPKIFGTTCNNLGLRVALSSLLFPEGVFVESGTPYPILKRAISADSHWTRLDFLKCLF